MTQITGFKPVVSSVAISLVVSSLNVAMAANILSFFPVHPESHRIVKSALMTELASRGHNVTIVSPYEENNALPNYEEIIIKEVLQLSEVFGKNVFKTGKDSGTSKDVALFIWKQGIAICELILRHPQIQQLIHSRDRHFDLIILEAYFGDCFIPFSKKFNAPVIKVSLFSGTPWMYDWIGNPTELSYVPDPYLDYTHKMTFSQRFWNVVTAYFYRIVRTYDHMPTMDSLVRKYYNFSEELPPLWEVELEVTSLSFFNTHFCISYPRPLLPNAINIGGMHLKPPKKLPQDIQTYLDEAKHGVVYFSMGSVLSSAYFPEPIKKAFLEAFSKLKENVLWKFEAESLPGKPENVKIGKWLPQSDILAHPNIKLFITHGGLLSIIEAIDRGVPVIGIPIFGDQKLNIVKTERAGLGIHMDFNNISEESVTWALREVLHNPKYKEQAQKLSKLFRDQPLTPMQQAVFWTEYIIRHKGAPHMRSAALDLTWYQYFLLDVRLLRVFQTKL
ncbi:hypothetical protein L9F63_000312, partial [Diploptera punctata]